MDFDIHVLTRYLPALVQAAGVTLLILFCSLALGTVLGVAVCVANLSASPTLRLLGRAYVNAFRNTPEVVMIFWVYFCLPQIIELRLSPFATGTLALGLSASASLGEIFRAGVRAVPTGQIQAAQALGLRPYPIWIRILIPQAIRLMTPAFVNYLTELLKHSTLLSAIGIGELAHAAFVLGGRTFRYFEFFTAIGLFFFLMIFPLSVCARRLGGSHHSNRALKLG